MLRDFLSIIRDRPQFARAFYSVGDLKKILSDKFGPVRTTGGCNGPELVTTCPFCGHRDKLSVNGAKRVYHCWHCNESGTLRSLIGRDIQIRRMPEPPKPAKQASDEVWLPSINADGIMKLSSLADENPAIVYIRSRGFDPDELENDFSIGYCPVGRRFPNVPFDATNTLVIPVNVDGRLVGWQARLLYDPKKVSDEILQAFGYTLRKDSGELKRPPKYMTSPGLNKRGTLYNIDWARKSDTVVVTEGVFDCIRVGRKGVATFGKLVSDDQRRMLASLWKTVVLLLDPDAQEDQEKLAREMSRPGGPRIVKVALKGYKDAGDCPRDELWRQIDAAIQN